jgi:transcriptional regulator with XRE-family HTH domain
MARDTNGTEPPHELLGALVRERRERIGLSMDELARRARISRSSLHRLEHGERFRPQASNLARVLVEVGIGDDDVRSALPAGEYRDDVLIWIDRANQLAASRASGNGAQARADDGSYDLVLMRGDEPAYFVRLTPHVSGHSDELCELAERFRVAARDLGLRSFYEG